MSDRYCLTVNGIPVEENTNRIQYLINNEPVTIPEFLTNTDFAAYVYDEFDNSWTRKNEWRHIHIYQGVKYYSVIKMDMDGIILCYPQAFPLRDLDITLHFGNSSSDDSGIEYGLYTTDGNYNPILRYDNGYIVTENGSTLDGIYLNDLVSAEEHWIRFVFDGQHNKLIVTIKDTDATNDVEGLGYDRVEIPYSDFELDFNQTCFVGVKSIGEGQEIWIKQFTAYWTKVPSTCEISTGSGEYVYPATVNGTCKVLSDYRTIYPLLAELSLKQYQGNTENTITLKRKKDTQGNELKNEFTFVDSPTPSTASYGYTFKFNGNLTYEPSETTINISVKDIPRWTWNEPSGKYYYSNEENTFSAILEVVNASGGYVRAKNKTVQCKIFQGTTLVSTLTPTTNNNGVVTVSYIPPSDGRYYIRWVFPETTVDKARYESKQLQQGVDVIHKSVTKISVSRGSTVQYYPNTITLSATLKNENNATLNNTPVEFFYYTSKNNTPVSLGVVNTNNKGVATVTPSLPPLIDDPENSTVSDCYYVYAKYYGDATNLEITSPSYSFKYIDASVLSLEGSYTNELFVKNELSVSVKLVDGAGVLSGRKVNYSLGVNGGTVLKTGSATTNTNGIITFKYTNNTIGDVDSTLTFTFPNNVSDGITGCSISFPVRWNKLDSEWTTIGTDNVYETDCKQYCKWGVQLKVKDDTLLPQTSVKREITVTNFDGSVAPEGTILTNTSNSEFLTGVRNTTTNNNSQIIISPKCNYGDIKAVVKFTFEETDLYHSSTISKTLKWNKIVTVWEDVYSSNIGYELFETECTLYCRWKGRIKGVDDHLFPDQPTRWKLVVTNLTGGTEPGTTLYEPGGVEIPKSSWSNYSHVLTNSGIEDFAMMSVYGDVKVVVTFYFDGDNCYKPADITKTFIWNRIETELVTYDLTHYATRFTNLEWDSVNGLTTSPGTYQDYMNIKALLQTVNSETDFQGVGGKQVIFQHGSNLLFNPPAITNNEGYILRRWKRDSVGVSIVDVSFAGDKQFKPTSNTMKITTLARIQPRITADYEIIYPLNGVRNYRYNIPFNIDVTIDYTVREDGVDVVKPLYPCMVEFIFNGVSKGFKSPNSEGFFEINRIRPNSVGELPIVYKYNESDLFDPYLPCIREDVINVDKDSPYITLDNLPQVLDTGCVPYQAKAHFYNSIGEKLQGGRIYWKENIGDTENGDLWEYLPVDDSQGNPTISGATGLVVKDIHPRSGVKLIMALFTENNWYYQTHQTSYIKWDITQLYGWDRYDGNLDLFSLYGIQQRIPVENGLVSFDLDCMVPEGLYDLRIDFVGDEGEECQKYADNTIYKGIHRKQGLKFVLRPNEDYNSDVEEFQKEATQQFSVPVALYNVDHHKYMEDCVVRTKVNNSRQLNKRTGENGELIRHHVNNTVDVRDTVSFYYDQTRKTAKCNLDTHTHTLKITPSFMYIAGDGSRYYSQKLDDGIVHYYKDTVSGTGFVHNEISEEAYVEFLTVTYYQYNEFDVEVMAYYLRNHYDTYGEEILMTEVYHHYSSQGIESYYVLVDGEQVPTTREVYEQSQHYNDVIPITNTTLNWKDQNNNTLITCTTDNQGYGKITYQRDELGTIPVNVTIENHSKYNNQQFPLKFKTIPRKTTLMTNDLNRVYTINYNGESHTVIRDNVKTTVYNEPCKLNCILKDNDGNPLKGKTIKFKQSSLLLGTAVTDENGYCEIPAEQNKYHYPTTAKDFMYQCIFYADGIYDKTEQVFTVHNSKQIPRLSVHVDFPEAQKWYMDDEITGRIEFRESEYALQVLNDNGALIPRPLKNRDIYFVIEDNNGTKYSNIVGPIKTNPNGKASFSIKPTGVGNGLHVKAYYNTEDKYYTNVETMGKPRNSNGVEKDIIIEKIPTKLTLQASKDSESGWRWKNNNPYTNSLIAPAYIEIGINGRLEDTRELLGYEKDENGVTDLLDSNGNKIPIYRPLPNQKIDVTWVEVHENGTQNTHNIQLTTNENGIVTQLVKGELKTIHPLSFSFPGTNTLAPISSPQLNLDFQTTNAVFFKHTTDKFATDKQVDISLKLVYLGADGSEKGISGIPLKFYNGPWANASYDEIPQDKTNAPKAGDRDYYTSKTTNSNGVAVTKYTFPSSSWPWSDKVAILSQFPFSHRKEGFSDPLIPSTFNWSDYPYFNTSIWCELNKSGVYTIAEGGKRANYHYKTDYTYAKQYHGNVIENSYPVGPENQKYGYQYTHVPYGNIVAPRIFSVNENCTISYTFNINHNTNNTTSTASPNYGFIIGLSETIGTWNTSSKTPFKMEYMNKNFFKLNGVSKPVTFSMNKDYTVTLDIEEYVLKKVTVGSYSWSPGTNLASWLNKSQGLKFFLFTAFGDNNTEIIIKEFRGVYNFN